MENIFVEFLPPWVETGLQPAFYDKESGTVLQQTARMYARVNMLIRMFNKLSKNTKETVEEYINKFTELHDYVQDYFDNLDVQEEINNKIDAMVADGTFSQVLGIYPELEGEVGVVAPFYTYGDVYRYGAKCDGTTDDTTALNNAITNAVAFNVPVNVHGKMYVSETINTHGALIIGDKQPTKSGAYYPDGIGYDYPKNMNDGFYITFANYINTIPNGTCIISDTASPILSTDYDKPFNLENFGVYGWLRKANQIGIEVNTEAGATYYNGNHSMKNFSVFNTSSYGIHLHSLETAVIKHVFVELTNSYGIYIEGLGAGIDTPCDYSNFEDCQIRYTRLAGVKFLNTVRKNIVFEHCNFNFIGQYDFGECNDPYGERELPSSNDNIIYSIDIDGLDVVNAPNLRYIQFNNNYGEKTLGFIKIRNVSTINGFKESNNMFTKGFATSVSCYINASTAYMFDAEFDDQNTNFDTKYAISNLQEITSNKFIPNQLMNATTKAVVFKASNKSGYKAFKAISGDEVYSKNNLIYEDNFTYYNTAQDGTNTVDIDVGAIYDVYCSNQPYTHGQSYCVALLSLSAGGNTDSPAPADLITITKANNKYYIGFLTKNLTATVSTNGHISLSVTPWRIATLQFLQKVSKY